MFNLFKIDFMGNIPKKQSLGYAYSYIDGFKEIERAAQDHTDEHAIQKRNAVDGLISIHNKIGDKILYLFMVEKV